MKIKSFFDILVNKAIELKIRNAGMNELRVILAASRLVPLYRHL
jgi:hypothetical protein